MIRTLSFLLVALALVGLWSPAANGAATYITNVVETGTDLSSWGTHFTGQTFEHQYAGAGYTVPALGEDVLAFSDRTHEYNGSTAENTIASLGLAGADYVMSANNNRSVEDLQLDISVNAACDAFLFYDARLTPPSWISDNWEDLGLQRLGIDESGDGDPPGPGNGINQEFTIWKMSMADAGTFSTYASESAGKNMYGVAVTGSGQGPDRIEPPVPPDYKPIAFSYSTADGMGTISGMLDTTGAGGTGDVLFTAEMPVPANADPNPLMTPAGSVGTVTEATGDDNLDGKTAGINWDGLGPVTLTGTDGVNNYSVPVELIFGPSGDTSYNNPAEDPLSSYNAELGPDYVYTWAIEVSDDAVAEHGGDAVSPGGSDNPRMATYFGVGAEDPNGLAHRFTQIERQFNVGPDAYTNTHETTGSGKYSKFAAYQPLGIFYGWRDREDLAGGSFQVNSVEFAGNLPVDLNLMTATVIPEPSTLIMLLTSGLLGLGLWLRRR